MINVMPGIICGLLIGVYWAHRKAKALGIDKHPLNIAFMNATLNSIVIAIIFVVTAALGG